MYCFQYVKNGKTQYTDKSMPCYLTSNDKKNAFDLNVQYE